MYISNPVTVYVSEINKIKAIQNLFVWKLAKNTNSHVVLCIQIYELLLML